MTKIKRDKPPQFKDVTNFSVPKIEKLSLLNNLPVYFIKTTNKEISEVIFNFDAGIWKQPQLLVASMTKNLLAEGTKYHNSSEIADTFDYYGAHFNASLGMHYSHVKLMALNKYMPKLINLVAEILNYAEFPKKEFEIIRQKYKQQLIIDLEEEYIIARNALELSLFGNNSPYGKSAIPKDYDRLTTDVLKKFFLENYITDNLKIIVASNQKQEIIDLLNKYFFNFRKGEKTTVHSDFKQEIGEKYIFKERKDALQSAVRVGWNLFDIKHKDSVDMSILETLLGGYFGSRLMQNIRQKKGYTYSIYSMMNLYKYAGSIQIISEVKKENKEQVLEEIKKEVKRLQNELVSKEELYNLKNYMMGYILQSLDGDFKFAGTLNTFLVYDLDLNYLQNYAKRIKEITPERLAELAQKYMKLDEMHTVIVG